MKDITKKIMQIANKKILKFIPKILMANAKEINTRIKYFYEDKNKRNLGYKDVFEAIYFTTQDTINEFFSNWEKGMNVPEIKMIYKVKNKYVCIDNTQNQFFVEEYDSLEKALLYFQTDIDIYKLVNYSTKECIDEMIE